MLCERNDDVTHYALFIVDNLVSIIDVKTFSRFLFLSRFLRL